MNTLAVTRGYSCGGARRGATVSIRSSNLTQVDTSHTGDTLRDKTTNEPYFINQELHNCIKAAAAENVGFKLVSKPQAPPEGEGEGEGEGAGAGAWRWRRRRVSNKDRSMWYQVIPVRIHACITQKQIHGCIRD